MKYFFRSSAFVLIVLTVACALNDALTVRAVDDEYAVTAPVSELVLYVPKGRFRLDEQQSDSSKRYFFFTDQPGDTVISGWFEPARFFRELDALWQEKLDRVRATGFVPHSVESISINGGNALIFSISIEGKTQTNIWFEKVDAGTWVEMHLSRLSSAGHEANRTALVELLQRCRFEQKPGTN